VRALAAQVAQDRIELAHNVIYDNIGTVGGIPAGTLPQTETITMGGQTFQIQTSVVYIDDKGDEIAPADPIPTDYKRVRVEVTWDGAYSPGQSVVLWTDIAPKGLETMEDAGTLAKMAFDSTGKPVENATVTIVADTTTPPVNMTTYTDSLGMVMLPGAPIGIESYQITVTKSGYTTDRTYGSSEVTNPLNPHATVLEGLLTNVSLAIDRPSTLAIRTVRDITSGYAWFQGVRVKVQGTKEIGRTATDDPVYKFDQDVITGTGGLVNLSNLEWILIRS